MGIRLNKYLANCGVVSRRKADELILAGKVKVNGKVVTELGTMIDEQHDLVECNRIIVRPDEKKLYILLNKPANYIVSRSDEYQRKTVYDLLPGYAAKCVPVGRLDKDSEGLLLLTNDGDTVQTLTHPSLKVEKVYKVIIDSLPSNNELNFLRTGVLLETGKTLPAGIFVNSDKAGRIILKVVIREGKKRQIRKMLESIGKKVLHLKRLQVGEIKLGKLPSGDWRFLTRREIDYLKQLSQRQKKQ